MDVDVDDVEKTSPSRLTADNDRELYHPPSPQASACHRTPSEEVEGAAALPFQDASAPDSIHAALPPGTIDGVAPLPSAGARRRGGTRDALAERAGRGVSLSDDDDDDDDDEQTTDVLRTAYRLPSVKIM